MRLVVVGAITMLVLVLPMFASADMSSADYSIRWDTVSTGGQDTGSSTSYLLRDTLGNLAPNPGSSASYTNNAGYRAGVEDQVVSFDVEAEDRTTQTAATVLVGNNVTVNSAVAYAIGNFIAVVQDPGTNQVTAVGKIVNISGNTLTVDAFKTNGTAPVIDGNDFVYKLFGNDGALGNFNVASPNVVNTELVGLDVTADIDNGYTVQVASDGALRGTGGSFPDVSGGHVTGGTQSYGARSSDTSVSGFGTQDTPLPTSYATVASASTPSTEARNFLTLKAAISPSTAGGTYSQTLSFILSGNF